MQICHVKYRLLVFLVFRVAPLVSWCHFYSNNWQHSLYFAKKWITWNDTNAALPKTDSKTNATAKLDFLGTREYVWWSREVPLLRWVAKVAASFYISFFQLELFRVVLSTYFTFTGKVRVRIGLQNPVSYTRNTVGIGLMGLTIQRMKGLNISSALIAL